MTIRAILLAAGEGSRLRPLTHSKPKPMLRAANKPILHHTLEALTSNGVKDIVFVLGYQRAKVQSYFGDGARFGARISYAFQDALLGTAHALATAPRPNGSFLVIGGDNVVDAALIKSILSAPGDGPALAIHRSNTPSGYGVVTLEGDRVARIEEKPAHPRSEWVSTGVYRATPDLYDLATHLSKAGRAGLPEVLQASIDSGKAVHAVRSTDLWVDAVYPWDILRMHGELLRHHRADPPPAVHADPGVLVGSDPSIAPGVVLGAGTCIGNNVEIGAHAVLENCVVYDDAKIGPGAILRNTIVGEGARLGPRVTAISGACEARAADGWHALDDFGAVVGEDARVGGAVTLLPGTILGNKVRVAHGRTVGGTIEDHAHIV